MKIDKKLKWNMTYYLLFELFLGIFVGAYGFLLGPYVMHRGYKEDIVGTLSLIQTISFALFAYVTGILSTKFSDKTLFAATSVLCFISSVLLATSKNFIYIILAVIVYALGLSIVVVIKTPFIVRNTKGFNAVNVISIILTYCVTTNLIGNYLAGNLTNKFDYEKTWIIFAFFALVSFLPAIFINTDKKEVTFSKANIKINFTPRMFFLIMYTSLGSFAFGLIGPFYTTFLISKLNLNTLNASFINNFNIIGMILAMLLSPYSSKIFGKTKTLWYAKLLSFPVIFILSFVKFNSIFLIGILSILYLLRALFLNVPIPIESDLIMKSVAEGEQAKFNSVVVLANNLTVALSSLMAGFIIAEMPNGYEITFIMSSIFFLMQGFLFYKFSSNFIKKKRNDGLSF